MGLGELGLGEMGQNRLGVRGQALSSKLNLVTAHNSVQWLSMNFGCW